MDGEQSKKEVLDNFKSAGVMVTAAAEQLTTDKPLDVFDTVEEKENQTEKQSAAQEAFGAYMMDFAKRNYKKVMSADGHFIKIKNDYYKITVVTEEVEDKFDELEKAFQTAAASGDRMKLRAGLYDFLTFACSIPREKLKSIDRGELKIIATILGMIQQGFRDL